MKSILGSSMKRKEAMNSFRGVGSYSCSASESRVERPALHQEAG